MLVEKVVLLLHLPTGQTRHSQRATSRTSGSLACSLVGDTFLEALAGVFFTALPGSSHDLRRLRVTGLGLTKGAAERRSSALSTLHSSSTEAALESVFSKPIIKSGFLALANLLRPGLASVRLPAGVWCCQQRAAQRAAPVRTRGATGRAGTARTHLETCRARGKRGGPHSQPSCARQKELALSTLLWFTRFVFQKHKRMVF